MEGNDSNALSSLPRGIVPFSLRMEHPKKPTLMLGDSDFKFKRGYWLGG